MIDKKMTLHLKNDQIKALVLLMKKESSLDCELKQLYDELLDYMYDSMTIEEADFFFNEN